MSNDWLSNSQTIYYEDIDDSSTMAVEDRRPPVQEHYHEAYKEDKGGFFTRFLRGMRGCWSTRQTEDIEDNRDLLVRTTLRELVIYVIFLILLIIITFGMTNGLSFYYTNTLNGLFLNAPLNGGSGSYASAASISDYWNFLMGPLLTGLYWSEWYNSLPVAPSEQNLIYYENKLVGLPRLRQVRVGNNSCVVPDNFKNTMPTCYASYFPSTESTATYGLANSTAWIYTSEAALNGRSSPGTINSYGGGGFYVDLNSTKSDSLNTIAMLFNNLWIDRGTRAAILDFTVYNANINLFCVIKLVAEFPSTGGLITNFDFRTVKLVRYVSPTDYFVLAAELLFLAFILYYTVEEIIEIRKHKLSYFNSFWNILDLIVVILGYVCIFFNVYRTITVQNILQKLLLLNNAYPDFDFISSIQLDFNYAIAFLLFFAWIKVFKYITFNKTMSQMSVTIGRCAKDLLGFGVMFFIIFVGFAQLGYLLFSSSCVSFKSLQESIFSLFRLILGDFNFNEFQRANAIFGPLYFFLYVFFVFFVLFNMFLAIINDTYAEVHGDLETAEDEFKMGDYFKQRANFIISKLNIKKEQIIDMQNAMGMADADGDNKIDFEEWKSELKNRGYEDAEIERVFSRYDTDGNRVLDKSERDKMQEELENEKNNVNSEIKKTEVQKVNAEYGKGTVGIAMTTVSMEDYEVLTTRVDHLEISILETITRLDNVMKNIQKSEKRKTKKVDTMGVILNTLTSTTDNVSEVEKRKKIENLVNEEINSMSRESTMSVSSKSIPKSDSKFQGTH